MQTGEKLLSRNQPKSKRFFFYAGIPCEAVLFYCGIPDGKRFSGELPLEYLKKIDPEVSYKSKYGL